MKQLARKMFLLVAVILILMGAMVSGFSLMMEWNDTTEEVRSDLERANASMTVLYRGYSGFHDRDRESISMDEDYSMLADEPLYTLILSDRGQVENMLYLNGSQKSAAEAFSAAQKILEKGGGGLYGGLDFLKDRYAWYYPDRNSLTLMDTSHSRKKFVSILLRTGLLFLAYLAAVLAVTKILVRKMIQPIEDAFNKQKQFIADASHELKTPIAVILSNAEAMERNPDVKWLHNIETEADRMNGLVCDLLELTRSEQRKLELHPIDLGYLAEKECMIQEARIFEKGLQLEEQIPEGIFAVGEENSLMQVIGILLDNAIAHAKSVIRVSLVKNGSQAELSVSNNGEMIPPEDQKMIFERFARAEESRNRNENRYGLGLAIARNLMIQNEGSISVSSSPEWTTFTLNLRAAGQNGQEARVRKAGLLFRKPKG